MVFSIERNFGLLICNYVKVRYELKLIGFVSLRVYVWIKKKVFESS